MLVTAIGGASQANSSYQAGKTNAAIDRYNAANARIQEQQAIEAGSAAKNQVAIKGSLLQGAQTAGFAGQGVVATAGTARQVVATGEAVSAMDQMMIGINARRQAFGYQVQASNADFQATLARSRGNQGAMAALISTGARESEFNDPNYRGKGTTVNPNLLAGEGAVSDGSGSSMAFT
jgi:hypothetical protein